MITEYLANKEAQWPQSALCAKTLSFADELLGNYAGFYPLGNLARPKNQLVKIRGVRAINGQKSGKGRRR
jgi:hypothetical protein